MDLDVDTAWTGISGRQLQQERQDTARRAVKICETKDIIDSLNLLEQGAGDGGATDLAKARGSCTEYIKRCEILKPLSKLLFYDICIGVIFPLSIPKSVEALLECHTKSNAEGQILFNS